MTAAKLAPWYTNRRAFDNRAVASMFSTPRTKLPPLEALWFFHNCLALPK